MKKLTRQELFQKALARISQGSDDRAGDLHQVRVNIKRLRSLLPGSGYLRSSQSPFVNRMDLLRFHAHLIVFNRD